MFIIDSNNDVFSEDEKEDIDQAIKNAEIDSSCEFKVHVDRYCKEETAKRSEDLFYKLGVDKTERHNGILFYAVLDCRKFIIKADKALDQKLPEGFWDDIYHVMLINFRKGNYAYGISQAILKAGEKLKPYYPWMKDDRNEVSDDLSIG